MTARLMSKKFGSWRREQQTVPLKYKHEWTLTHGFFVLTRGIGVETDGGREFLPGLPHVILKAQGFLIDQHAGWTYQISEQMIKDRSKTDGIARGLACLMGGFLIVQVVSGLVCELPLHCSKSIYCGTFHVLSLDICSGSASRLIYVSHWSCIGISPSSFVLCTSC